MLIPELFGDAPTASIELLKPQQAYGSSGLPGAPTATEVTPPPATISPYRLSPPPTAHDTNPATQLPLVPSDLPPGTLYVYTPPTATTTTTTPTTTTPATTTPATTTPAPTNTAATNDAFQRLVDLAASQQSAGGGGGGVVALPTGIDTGSSAAPSSGISKAGIFLIIAVIAIAIYFYSRHKKKTAEHGGGEKKE